ncbi:peptidoglycan -binding protein [Inquilinus sp. CAU 1745]|uniref:peptidoglycan -binding protein n=1 Tax=Inquilinus sp. CAU 1745 TaxID=3140369 RepID=UPI00325B6A1F
MAISARRANRTAIDIWPGYVDALSSLIMVVTFTLMIFFVAQFFLTNTITGQDQRLTQLNSQIAELADLLDLERSASEELEIRYAQLSADLQAAVAERNALGRELDSVADERDALSARLAAAIARGDSMEAEQAELDARLADAYTSIEADRETLELRLSEIASLQNDIQALRAVREDLELQVAALERSRQLAEAEAAEETEALRAELEQARQEAEAATVELRLSEEQRDALLADLTAARDRSQALETQLSDAEERTALAQREIDEQDIRIEELVAAVDTTEAALDEEMELTSEQQAQVALLNDQIAALRDRLGRVQAALEASEAEVGDQDIEIANLNARLNQALIRRVEELNRYRSEFFGRLREVLGDREDIRIVGDRFVFQSEVLFPSGSATLQPGGRERLAELADELMNLAEEFPEEVDWLLRVDGHTDRRPISTPEFRSNWELSTARAIEVVQFLIDQGVPPERLAAAGFADNQPLDPANTPEAYERNRRIELQLDQR